MVLSEIYTGEGLEYTHERFSAGKCNFMYDPGVGNYYAALNSDQWDSTLSCGRCVEVSSEDSSNSVTVYIVDECTECEDEGLGLSPLVSKQLTRSGGSIKWRFVDCPVSGGIEYCVNSQSKSSWLAVQPANSVAGVKSMKIDNQQATVVDSGFYFLLNSRAEIDTSKVEIELTSLSGETIKETVSLSAGNCTAGTLNFAKSAKESEVNEYFDTLKSGDGYKAGQVTAPDDSEDRAEATSSGSSLLFIIPVLVAVCVLMAVYWFKKKKTLAKRVDGEKVVAAFGTLSSPVRVKETIAKI